MDFTTAKKKIKLVLRWDELPPKVRRLLVATVGGMVLLIGIALIVLPGPAFLVIPLGLAILATEFAWARYSLRRARSLWKRNPKAAQGGTDDRHGQIAIHESRPASSSSGVPPVSHARHSLPRP